jgi:hypothetical protein
VDILALMKERARDYDCPVCKRSLDGCSLTLVRQEDPLYTVQVSCAKCQVTFVVVLQVREQGIEEKRRRTVTPRRKRTRRPAAPPISVDELIDLHQLLQEHHGRLTDLFSDRRGRSRSR